MALSQTSAEDGNGYLLISGDGATGSAAPAQTIQVGGTDGTNLRTLSTSTTGILNTQLPIQVTTGTLTSGSSTVVATLQSTGSVNVDVSGTWVGTITITEVYPSGGRTLGVFALNASPIAMNITANGNYRVVGVPISSTLQVAFTSYTSGTATINIYAAATPYIVQPYSANAANVLVTSYLNDGSGNSISSTSGALNINLNNSIPTGTNTIGSVKITDGTNVGGVAPASTAVTATQPAQVVAFSPNTPLPSGTNTIGTVLTKVPLTATAPQTASVGTSSVQIVAANANRKGLILTNTTPYQISFGFGQTAAYQYGLTIYPGEKYIMDQFSFFTGAINAISSAATYIGIQEFST